VGGRSGDGRCRSPCGIPGFSSRTRDDARLSRRLIRRLISRPLLSSLHLGRAASHLTVDAEVSAYWDRTAGSPVFQGNSAPRAADLCSAKIVAGRPPGGQTRQAGCPADARASRACARASSRVVHRLVGISLASFAVRQPAPPSHGFRLGGDTGSRHAAAISQRLDNAQCRRSLQTSVSTVCCGPLNRARDA